MSYPKLFETGGVFAEVDRECQNQKAKFGVQSHTDGTSPTFKPMADAARMACDRADREGSTTWFHIAREEFWGAMSEIDRAKLRAELVQLAAVAVSWVMDIDRTSD